MITSVIILSSVPPVSRDALTHHLAIPKLYLKHGGIYEIPSVVFSYYPMNIDLLYLIPLYFGNDIVPKLIHFTFALLTAWLIYSYLRPRTNLFFSLFGSAFFLSLPLIVKLSITVYVDLGLIFFTTASIIYIFKWVENSFKLKNLILSGVWCGLALGTKYNALIVLFLLSLSVPYVTIKTNKESASAQREAIKYGAIFVLVSLIIYSPWMIRNYIWTKNPIYPLYDSWFNPGKVQPRQNLYGNSKKNIEPETDGSILPKVGSNPLLYRKIIYNESWWQIALVPVRIFFSGRDSNPQYFDGKLNPFLFILPFFAFILPNKKRPYDLLNIKILAAFSVLFLLYAFFKIDMRLRYIAPIIPLLVILSIVSLYQLNNWTLTYCKESALVFCNSLVIALMIGMLMINTVYIVQQFIHVKPLSYITGQVGRDEYIEKFCSEYPVLKYANNNLSDRAKILSIFLGNRIYYSDRMMLSDANLFFKAVERTDDSAQIQSDLKKVGITHLIVRIDLFDKWINDNYDDRKKKLIKNFFSRYTHLLFAKNGYFFFKAD
jgi:hypothetical protein